MRSLEEYIRILEGDESTKIRSQLKFIIYKEDGSTMKFLNDREPYQKISCLYQEGEDYEAGIAIEFLLGREDDTWQLWAGKPGVVNYSDEPYKDLKTKKFSDAVNNAVDEAEKFIETVKKEPNNWVQFYVNG